MLIRVIAKEHGERCNPEDAENAENDKRPPPAERRRRCLRDQERRDCSAPAAKRPKHALGDAAAPVRKPVAERACDIWISACLASAKEKSDQHQRHHAVEREPAEVPREKGHEPGESSKRRPPNDNAAQYEPRAELVAQPAAGNF